MTRTNSESFLQRGTVYYEEREYDKAIADFTKAIEIDPKNASGYHGRALVYRATDKTEKAEADFAKARELGYRPSSQRNGYRSLR